MKMKNKILAFVEIAIVLCSVFFLALPAIAAEQTMQTQEVSAITTTASEDDYVLGIYGNANEDDTIDMRDLTYVKLIFFGKKPETELADAKYDGKINPLDFIQIKLIIVGKEKELTLVDSADRIVTVKKPIKRVVVIHHSIVEAMRSIKGTDKIVGVIDGVIKKRVFFSEFSDYPSVGSPKSPDIEKLLELKPDVVFYGAYYSLKYKGEFQKKLELADPNIAVVNLYCYKPENFWEEIRKLGYILGKKKEAEKFIDFYQGWMNTIKEQVEKLSDADKPSVYFEYWRPYHTAGGDTGFHQRIVVAGGNNIFSDLFLYPEIDAEEVIERDPQIIVGYRHKGGYDMDDITELIDERNEIMNRPELAKVAAVKNGKVYITTSHVMAGPGHFVGTTYLAKWFHPDLFADMNPQAIQQEYITGFQGLNYDLDRHGVFVYPPLPS